MVREFQGDLTELLMDLHECIHHVSIEMFSTAHLDDLHRFGVRERRLVNPFADKGVVNVGDGHEPARYGYFFSLQSPRAPRAVPFFLVGVGDLAGKEQKGLVNIAAKLHLHPENGVASDDGVVFHFRKLLRPQPGRLKENGVRDAHLSDVMKRRGFIQLLYGLFIEKTFISRVVLQFNFTASARM